MENERTYSATEALRDEAAARVTMARQNLLTRYDYLIFGLTGFGFLMQGVAQLLVSPWSYVLLVAALLAVGSAVLVAHRLSLSSGFIARYSVLARNYRGPLALVLAGLLTFALSLPARDLAGLTPWLPLYASVVTALCITLSVVWLSRLTAKDLAAAEADLARFEEK